jgi:hypothetical protein
VGGEGKGKGKRGEADDLRWCGDSKKDARDLGH